MRAQSSKSPLTKRNPDWDGPWPGSQFEYGILGSPFAKKGKRNWTYLPNIKSESISRFCHFFNKLYLIPISNEIPYSNPSLQSKIRLPLTFVSGDTSLPGCILACREFLVEQDHHPLWYKYFSLFPSLSYHSEPSGNNRHRHTSRSCSSEEDSMTCRC